MRLARRLLGRDREADGRPFRIRVTRDSETVELEPRTFGEFPFRGGEKLEVVPADRAAGLPTSWGDVVVPLQGGLSVRVPRRMELHEVAGLRVPVHLIRLSGSEPADFAEVGKGHVRNYLRFLGLGPETRLLDVGCGIGRDALQLVDVLAKRGRYVGVDVTRDVVEWCTRNITAHFPAFTFHHVDARHELYNPFGTLTPLDVRLPAADASVGRITAVSLVTHLLEDEIVHYLTEFRRVLVPTGRAYVTFFLYSAEAAASAARASNPWGVRFDHAVGDGFLVDDPDHPRGAVAFTQEALQRMLARAGLKVAGRYLKGSWSGLHADADGGQDGAILVPAPAR